MFGNLLTTIFCSMNTLFQEFFLEECRDEYCTGIFSDELDKMGYKNQVINGWKLNNLSARLFGIARTITVEEIDTNDERISTGLSFLASLKPGEIMLVKGSNRFAYFGELMSRLATEVKLEGVVIDGLTRDTFYTQHIPLPIYAKGYSPVDIKGRGRVGDVDETVEIDGIKVASGDYIFADSDAVVFIPKDVMPQLIERVNKAALEELEIKHKIKKGVSIKEILLAHKEF